MIVFSGHVCDATIPKSNTLARLPPLERKNASPLAGGDMGVELTSIFHGSIFVATSASYLVIV